MIKALKLIKVLAIINKNPNEIGKKIFQPNLINWSYLYLGNVPRTKINRKMQNNVLIPNQNTPGKMFNGQISNGGNHPPKNKITVNEHIKIMLLYSARKKSAKLIAEYSTLYPETNSASASGKSKGCLFVSAKAQIKKIRNIGNNGMQYQIFFCAFTISFKFKDPANKITEIIVIPIETSYEIICAAERNAPKKAYFELLDQPAIITECTLKDDIAKIYNKPIFKLDKANPFPKGITAHPAKAKANVNTGAKIKISILELFGKIVSFKNNFKPSANGCRIPKNPTIFGPWRRWIAARTWRSINVKYATAINNGTINERKYKIVLRKKSILFL